MTVEAPCSLQPFLCQTEAEVSLVAGLWLQCKTAAAALQPSYTKFGIENICISS